VSSPTKSSANDAGGAFDFLSDLLWGGAAASTLGEPEDNVLPGVLGILAAGVGVLGDICNWIADDPPQPDYAKPVVFKQRVSHPPVVSDRALEPFRVSIQQAVFGAVTAKGFLDAIERLQGAQLAGDTTWGLVHRGVADQAFQQYMVDIANTGAALYAAGNAIKGTNYDIAFRPGMSAVKKWINTRGTKATLAPAMKASGLTASEIKNAFAYANTDPTYKGPASTLSQLLIENAEKIFAIAVAMNEQS
jgi:hypothetical protein